MSSGSRPPGAASAGSTLVDLGQELLAGQQLDTVDVADPGRHGVLDDDHRRRGALEDGSQLVVGQAVVDGHERQPGEPAAEQEHRDGLGVDVDEADALDPAVRRPGRRPAGRGPSARRT